MIVVIKVKVKVLIAFIDVIELNYIPVGTTIVVTRGVYLSVLNVDVLVDYSEPNVFFSFSVSKITEETRFVVAEIPEDLSILEIIGAISD